MTSKKFTSKAFVLTIVFGLLLAGGFAGAAFFYMQYQRSQTLLQDPAKANVQETIKVVDEVGKIIVLPQNEQPQVATVSDANKLKEQAFFAQAKNGDIVLIYTKAQKAILYDPRLKKVVEVGPINIAEASPSANPTRAELRVALYNGTSVSGLSTTTEKDLKQKASTVIVVSKGNAVKATYTKTIVVDLTGKHAASASQLAKILNGEVGALPSGEVRSTTADIAVILGRD